MSLETNIYFKCEKCGHNRIAYLETEVVVSSRVDRMIRNPIYRDSLDLVPILSGRNCSDGLFIGYACEKCHEVFAFTMKELHDYLSKHNMIGEYRFMED